MSFYQEDKNSAEFYPIENYESLRKNNHVSSSEAIIPYKPADEPAWYKHNSQLPPKPARFSKLHGWDQNRSTMLTVVRWVVVAAGAATLAGPAIMQIPH